MEIKKVQPEELYTLLDGDGLVLQGCGGDLSEWINGINKMFTDNGILQDGTKFEQAYSFPHNGLTNLLFPFTDDVKVDVGELAMWRIQTHSQFGGTWLSDYIDNNHLPQCAEQPQVHESATDGQSKIKPNCPLIGADGNVFALMGMVSKTLKQAGQPEEAKEMRERVMESGSFDTALAIMTEYVNVVSEDDVAANEEEYEEMGMSM